MNLPILFILCLLTILGVQLFHNLFVSAQQLRSFKFERWCQRLIVHIETLQQIVDLALNVIIFDLFKLLQARFSFSRLDIVHHQLLHHVIVGLAHFLKLVAILLRSRRQLLIGPQTFLFEMRHQPQRIWHHHRHHKRLEGIAINPQLIHWRCFHVRILQVLRGNILAHRSLEHVLAAINDAQRAIGIHSTNVASRKPAVFIQCFLGRLFILEVSVHDGRASELNLATRIRLIGCQITTLGCIHQSILNVIHWHTNVTQILVFHAGEK
mmetsp:Transcript_27282/g.44817  ORF Transcript_27282/g.44817 Transcript_27282/m.44817 type:complete len:267 (-) Transcript_27282:1443-2243(-)